MSVLDKLADAATKMGQKVATAPSNEAAAIKNKTDAVKEYQDAVADKPIIPKATPPSVNPNKVDPKSQYGTRPGEQRISDSEIKDMSRPLGSFKKGTNYVPHTGVALLHKGEAVIPAKENKMADMDKTYEMVKGMSKEEKPKKEIAHIKTSKAKSGGYVHEHHHTRPEHHPMETHVSSTQDAMADHMMQHMGEPNPGEAEADAGQSGVPAAGAAPTPGM
jgi:hypothetical protein